MPYVSVPRDLTRVKAKVLFGLTKRQVAFVGAAAAVSVPLFLLTMPVLGGDTASLLALIPAVPLIILGFYTSRDNQPLEKKIANYIRVRFILPRVRPYQTENIYKKLELLAQIEEVMTGAESDGSIQEEVRGATVGDKPHGGVWGRWRHRHKAD